MIGGLAGVYTMATGETQIAGMDSYWLDKAVGVSNTAKEISGTTFQDLTGFKKLEDKPWNPLDEIVNYTVGGLNLVVWTTTALLAIVMNLGAIIISLLSAPEIILLPFQIVFSALGVESYFSPIFSFLKVALMFLMTMYAFKFIMYLKNGVSM